MRISICDVVLNRQGLDRALAAAVAEEIVEASPMKTTVTLAAAFGCPFEGRVDTRVVLAHAARMAKADEVILADTIGVGVPSQVKPLVPAALENGTTATEDGLGVVLRRPRAPAARPAPRRQLPGVARTA